MSHGCSNPPSLLVIISSKIELNQAEQLIVTFKGLHIIFHSGSFSFRISHSHPRKYCWLDFRLIFNVLPCAIIDCESSIFSHSCKTSAHVNVLIPIKWLLSISQCRLDRWFIDKNQFRSDENVCVYADMHMSDLSLLLALSLSSFPLNFLWTTKCSCENLPLSI